MTRRTRKTELVQIGFVSRETDVMVCQDCRGLSSANWNQRVFHDATRQCGRCKAVLPLVQRAC